MTKTDLISKVAEKSQLSKKDSEKAVNTCIEVISETLSTGEKVQLVGFGTFDVRDRAAREGKNPLTGEKLSIPATRVPAFKAGKSLKELVSK
ncbi:MAG: HU family DNA-binding protein [Oscillospiraceae bacterium]|nr:HU family DNA-binding protein [Oscillospiraceae bacterium]